MNNNKQTETITEDTPFMIALNEARTAYQRSRQLEEGLLKMVDLLNDPNHKITDQQVKSAKANIKMYLTYYIHGMVGFDGLKSLLTTWGAGCLFDNKVWEELKNKSNKTTK